MAGQKITTEIVARLRAEIEPLKAEIERQRVILGAAGLDGAQGAAMLPHRQNAQALAQAMLEHQFQVNDADDEPGDKTD